MLSLFAKFTARVLFALRKAGMFVRDGRVLLSLILATSVIASLGTSLAINFVDAFTLSTYISANGTTASEWVVDGPSGPGLFDDAGALSTLANETLTGAPGSGGLAFGSMTGNTVLPTGALSWTAAAGALTCNAAASSSISTSTGTLSLDGPTVNIGPTIAGTVAITAATTVTINAPTASVDATSGGLTLQAAGVLGLDTSLLTAFNVSGNTVAYVQSSGFVPGNFGSTLVCGTGGTVVVPAESFGLVVTTGTLASNCIINFGTNAMEGLFVVDLSGATPGATFGIEFKNGTATKTFLSSSVLAGNLATVWTHGTNTLVVSY
jgi:hypothetical protein